MALTDVARGPAPARFLVWPAAIAALALFRANRPEPAKPKPKRPKDDPLSPSVARARREAEAARNRKPGTFEQILRTIPYATVIRDAAVQWAGHNAARLGAALAYYSVFSIGPLIVIAVAIAGLVFGAEAVRGQVMQGLSGLLGQGGAEAVAMMLEAANRPREGTLAIVIGIGTLVLAAIGVVMQLKDALNEVWEYKAPNTGGMWRFIRTYLLSLAGVMALGFLLMVSMLATTVLAALGDVLAPYFPEALGQILGSVVSFAIIALMFAAMFKWLPDAHIDWRDVWSGAILTAFLFELGKLAIAYYIGRQGLESTYGAAASIVVVLIWVYYSAQIVLFGAEFTNVIAKRRAARGKRPKLDHGNTASAVQARA
jgi:membrane protein